MAVDFERLTGIDGDGCGLFRDTAFEAWPSTDTGVLPDVSFEVGVADVAGSAFRVAVFSSNALAVEDDRDKALGGLRANMSLMLRRLSTSNSGSRRPDDGNMHRDEYSCCRSPPLNIPGGFMMSRI